MIHQGHYLRRHSVNHYVPNKHRYWRVRAVAVQTGGGGNFALGTLQMRAVPGGSDQCSGGTALADSTFDGTTPASNAFDGNNSTIWSSATGGANHWVGYDFGTPVNVNEVYIVGATTFITGNGTTIYVESSNDGSTWTTQWKHTTMANWTATEARTLTRPAFGDLRSYWRFLMTQNFLPNNYCSFAELAVYDDWTLSTNLASASNIVADTTFDGTTPVSNLFDGLSTTWWASGNVPAGTGNPFPHWLLWSPATARTWVRFTMTSRSSTPTLMPAIIIMQASLDQKTWVDYRKMGYPTVAASTLYNFDNIGPFEYVAA